ncbi:hypothetical protein C8Q73DRAFT_391279 [Cubamyces lactineus]|nr:hypothetical protein C8Q73DRAFT_391279 [Cubamyces lactineus]
MVLKEPPPPDLRALTPVFLTIQLAGGHIGLPILVATFLFCKTAKRHPTVVNFCVIWILYSIIYCLLLYGGPNLQANPPHALCLAQAAMNYGAPPMAVVAGLGVVLQVWSTFVEPWKEARMAHIPRWVKMFAVSCSWCVQRHARRGQMMNCDRCQILAPPYLVFFAFSLSAAYYGLVNPHWVTVKNGLYCGLMHGKFEMLAVPIFCGVFIVIIVGFEVATFVRYLQGRRIIKEVCPLVELKQRSISPWCRAGLFLVYAMLTFSACVMDLKQDLNAFAYMIQATLPLAAFLIFGLQKDVVLTWMFWNRHTGWRPETVMVKRTHRVSWTGSFMSNTTIDSVTPIATHPSSSLPFSSNHIV